MLPIIFKTFLVTLLFSVQPRAFADQERAHPPAASHARVHVRGSARFDLHATRSSGRVVVSGTVVDDAGRPVGRVPIAVTLSLPGTASAPLPTYEACSDDAARPLLESAEVLVLTADDAGYFCARLALAADSRSLVAHFQARTEHVGDGLIDQASADLPIDLSHDSITLRFDPERPLLSLDDPSTVVQVVASSDAEGSPRGASGLPIVLSNEAGVTLATATTDGAGHARFVLGAESLGAPGAGELRAFFAGNAQAAPASRAMRIEKRSQVELSAPDAVDGRLPAGSSEDGIAIRLTVRARCAVREACSRGAPPSGMVEARLQQSEEGSAILGAAPIRAGNARLTVTFSRPVSTVTGSAPGPGVPILRVRYVPDAPWYAPGPELRLEQPTRDPGVWTRLPLLFAAALMIVWLALARMPWTGAASREEQAPRRASGGAGSSVRPHVAVLHADAARAGWIGRVVDAHDGTVVASARVSVQRRGFDRVEVIASTVTNEAGRFELTVSAWLPHDDLVAEGLAHAELRRRVPPAGELQIALVSRKRALLDRLIGWTRRRGKPFDAWPEPTPDQVRRAAGTEVAVARWADAVERAAYGGAPIDGQAQAEVDRLAPNDATSHLKEDDDTGKGISAEARPARKAPRDRGRDAPRR
jgi:hypothetical protein